MQPDRWLGDHDYNVSAAKVSAVSTVDENASDRHMTYNGYEYNLNARLGHGISLFGGGMVERMITKTCDEKANPKLLLYCDQSQSGLPFRTQFKLAASVPLHYGITVSTAFQSLPGYLFGTSAQYALTGVSGPSGITTTAAPNGAARWLIRKRPATACPATGSKGCVVATWSMAT